MGRELGQNSAMDLHLNGKVVLITGGTDGLGAALADRLVEEGARVAVCGGTPADWPLPSSGCKTPAAMRWSSRPTSLARLSWNDLSTRPSPAGAASTAW